MFRRRQFLGQMALGGLALATAPIRAFGLTSATGPMQAGIQPSTTGPIDLMDSAPPAATGCVINGKWDPKATLWVKINGKRYRVLEHDARGIWFLPSDDCSHVALQPFDRTLKDGRSQFLLCTGSVYSVVTSSKVSA